MRTIADYMAKVREFFPQIGHEECAGLVWSSLQLICDEEELPFMINDDGYIVTEPPYAAGTVSIAGGVNVTLAGGAWDPAWTNRLVIIETRMERYGITITGGTTGQLSRPWAGTSTAGLRYTVFRDTYAMADDCDFAREMLVYDVAQGRELDFLPHDSFVAARNHDRRRLPGIPWRATRGPLDSAGRAQIIFDPAPSSSRIYLTPYYRSPQKPAGITAPITPVWPNRFHDVIPYRAVAEYAERKGHPRRAEFRTRYGRRLARMIASFDGGNELRRALESRVRDGLRVTVNVNL